MMQASKRCAVITGATGGIGTPTAHRLARDGWQLHLIDVDLGRLEKLRRDLQGSVTIAQSHLENPQACSDALSNAPEQIQAFVHLAGIFVSHDLGSESREIYDQTIQNNSTNAYDLVGALLPRMPDGARIVFASSMGFNRGVPDHVAYSMAKGALVGLTRALSRRLGERGIIVNAVAPGIIETPMPAHLIEQRGRDALLASIPLRRIGQPEEVTGVIAFLLSEDADYITGQVINVDGGIING